LWNKKGTGRIVCSSGKSALSFIFLIGPHKTFFNYKLDDYLPVQKQSETLYCYYTQVQEHSMSSEIDSDGNDVHETKEIITRRVQQKGLQKRIVPARRRAWIPPQNVVDKAWARFSVKIFSKATAVLPVTNPDHQHASPPPEQGQLVITNFEEAAKACRQKVEKIVKEHKRANQRYRDPHFDIYLDLMSRKGHCLGTLAKPTKWSVKNELKKLCPDGDLPKSVNRVDVSGELYDN
jgi:hypothetical protein